MVYTLGDLYRPGAYLDYPVGGSEAVVDALIRGITKTGKGELRLRTRVEEILVDEEGGQGRAAGVKLADGTVIKAREGVVSNAPIWDTLKLVPEGTSLLDRDSRWRKEKAETPVTGSFTHLHLGIDGTGLPEDLDCHHSVIFDWGLGPRTIEARENMYIVSIPR